MFKLIQVTETGGDCTCSYKVELDREYTVGDFIKEVLSERSKEWGSIGIYNDSSYRGRVLGDPKCDYKYGELVTKALDESYLKQKVVEVKAHGGWSLMNYMIKCEK